MHRTIISGVILLLTTMGLRGAAADTVAAAPRPPEAARAPFADRGDPDGGPPAHGDAAVEPAGPLDLATALDLALANSPELLALSRESPAAHARMIQAGLWPNPEVRLEIEDVGGPGTFHGADEAQATATLSQRIELGGKRAARRRSAELGRDTTVWDYEAERLDVLARTATAFVDVLAAQRRVLLGDEGMALAEQVVDAVARRVRAGSASEAELTRAEIALATARLERQHLGRRLATARHALVASWGGIEARFERAEGSLEEPGTLPTLPELRRRLGENPEVARWATEIARRDAKLALERSRRVPDVTVDAGYRRLVGPEENAFVGGISVPLPLFDRNQGGVLEARQRIAQAHDRKRAAEVRVEAALAAAFAALESAHAQIETLEASILPGAREAFEVVRAGYREGRFSYLDVLDAQRTLASARARDVGALADYHRARVAVERLIGAPLEPGVAAHDGEEP